MNQIKKNLAYAYQILAHLQLDDHTYTHLSARDAHNPNHFYIYPFGLRFEEVTASCLLKVDCDGTILEGEEFQYNRTGYIIHGNIYQARPDLQAVFHIHTPATVAVSSLEEGLLPINQWALHFYDRVGYHDYDSLALNQNQGNQLVEDLAEHKILFLRHHGVITGGATIQEALFYLYHLEQACKTQCLTLAMNQPFKMPSPEICKKAVHDLLSFEKNLGERDWQAWIRLIDAKQKNLVR